MSKVIDLSQPIRHKGYHHPRDPMPLIFTFFSHEDTQREFGTAKGGHSSTVKLIQMSEHTGSHVDAIVHFDPRPGAPTIDKMPLETFYGPAVCLDLSSVGPRGWIDVKDLEQACKRQNVDIQPGDIVLIYTGHHDRTYGTPAFLTDFAGFTPDAAKWLAAKGVRNFGVEAISVDHPSLQASAREKALPVHVVCRETGMTHMEGLANLDKLVGKGRFQFFGLPIKIEGGTGAPIRAVAILED